MNKSNISLANTINKISNKINNKIIEPQIIVINNNNSKIIFSYIKFNIFTIFNK